MKEKHGKSKSPTWISWCHMRWRCFNPKHLKYHYYGGRGITVCERWMSFKNFYADMGDRPEGHTLDRIDVDGNYEPGNCRWATPKTQANNQRKRKRQPLSPMILSKELGVSERCVIYRKAKGLPLVAGKLKSGYAPKERIIVESKKCTKCLSVKNGTEFPKSKKSVDGLSSWCKSCVTIQRKNRQHAKQ